MTRAYQRGGRAVVAPGVELDQHEDWSKLLMVMAGQARSLRGLLRRATGGSSPPSKAAAALLQAVRGLQQALLAELDRVHGEDAPMMTRTRYYTKG
jgi:hypothetical protein